MKKFLALCLSMALVFTLTGCDSGDHEGEAKTPSGSSVQKGRDYQSVVDSFEEQGFTNIQLLELDDLVTGWLTKEGEVEYVTVNGDEDYSADTWFDSDVEVVVAYHTFPEDDTSTSNNGENIESNSSEPEIVESDTDILTIDNCAELAEILILKSELDPAYSDFAVTYKNEIIEFDGCITYMVNHEEYDTRYDILISAGDYISADTVNPGPIFKFEDVGIYDLGLSGIELPDFVAVKNNIRVRAKVDEFNVDAGVFELDPVLIEAR